METTRKCVNCGKEKSLENFRYRTFNSSGEPTERRNDCNSCAHKESKIRNKLKNLWSHIKPNSDNHCPICLRKEEDIWTRTGNEYSTTGMRKKTPWVLDHNHDTKEFRGWICDYCNVGLSRFLDNIETMERAIKYLRKELPYNKFVEENKPGNLTEFFN